VLRPYIDSAADMNFLGNATAMDPALKDGLYMGRRGVKWL
jgi:hypothetical protein